MEFVDTKVKAFLEDKKTRDTLWVYSTDSYDQEMGGWIYAIREHCKIQQPPVFKGNWAYVYICKDFWLAAVDHYASVNLFFNDKIITHNWKLIEGYIEDSLADNSSTETITPISCKVCGRFLRYQSTLNDKAWEKGHG